MVSVQQVIFDIRSVVWGLTIGRVHLICGFRAQYNLDVRAAINLQPLATGVLATCNGATEASQVVMPGSTSGTVPASGGKVVPVWHEHGTGDCQTS